MELKFDLSGTKIDALAGPRNISIKITWINDTQHYLEQCEAVVSDDDGASSIVTATAYFGLMTPRSSRTQYVYLPTGFEKAATKFVFGGQTYPNFGLGDNMEELTITIS